jgi:hypothetical protein
VSRGAAGRLRQDDVLTVLGRCVDELLRIHRRKLVLGGLLFAEIAASLITILAGRSRGL